MWGLTASLASHVPPIAKFVPIHQHVPIVPPDIQFLQMLVFYKIAQLLPFVRSVLLFSV